MRDGPTAVADSRTNRRVSRFSRAAFEDGCENLFVRAYPAAHAVWEAATLAHWVRFLLGGGETHDPALALFGMRVARTSAREAMQRRVELETARASAVASLSRSPASSFVTRIVGPPLLRARHFAADYAQGGLMLCVVGFKLMEWWYGTAEEKVTGSLALPVPPPPPTPPPHRDGVAPREGACPLCGASPAVSPAAPAGAGYVCCHACLTSHIQKHSACPVTLLPARLEDIRKLFSE
jgi:peroxin-12